jgi:hypothetical protein
MCDYAMSVYVACSQLAEENDSFDMLQIRDRTREIVGPEQDVRFLPCKFEALAYFERGGIKGHVLTTKTIQVETKEPVIDDEGHHYVDGSGALVTEFEERNVFQFVKVASLIQETLRPAFTPA